MDRFLCDGAIHSSQCVMGMVDNSMVLEWIDYSVMGHFIIYSVLWGW